MPKFWPRSGFTKSSRICHGRLKHAPTALKRALAQLPPRRRAILIAARVDGLSHETIAERFDISRTMVQKELRRAIRHCVEYLEQRAVEGELAGVIKRLPGKQSKPSANDN